jgi:hypothetical protein
LATTQWGKCTNRIPLREPRRIFGNRGRHFLQPGSFEARQIIVMPAAAPTHPLAGLMSVGRAHRRCCRSHRYVHVVFVFTCYTTRTKVGPQLPPDDSSFTKRSVMPILVYVKLVVSSPSCRSWQSQRMATEFVTCSLSGRKAC